MFGVLGFGGFGGLKCWCVGVLWVEVLGFGVFGGVCFWWFLVFCFFGD